MIFDNIDHDKLKILDEIGLIALDLDRTTLSKDGLTQRTRECLEEAVRRGYEVVIATGRPYVALPESVKKIEGLRYVIVSNGAHIIDLKTEEFIFSDYMSTRASSWCRDYLRSSGHPVEVFTEGAAFISQERYDYYLTGIECLEGANYIVSTRKPVPDIWRFWEAHQDKIENINILFTDQDAKSDMAKRLLENEHVGYTLTSSMTYNLEIGGENTSKANALREFAAISGKPLSRVMGFGDSLNDLAMIRESGFGVAMGNAVDEVKNGADFITLTNDEDGVAYAIENLLFR